MTDYYVLDSYAMLAFFRKEEGAEKVKDYLNGASANKIELYMTCINAGEVYYMSVRKENIIKADIVWKALLSFPIHIINVDLDFTLAAANIKGKYSVSYADAFAAALTVKKKATLITGDHEFDALMKMPNFKVKYL